MRWGKPHSRAFTMVEILSAIAIISLLVAVMVPAIGNYVATARKSSNKQTLMVLNDALNRYKTQGGDLTALTSGASIGNILTKMKTPVTWAGVGHKFLNEGVTYAAASLSAVGDRAQYKFTRYGDFADGTEYSNGIISTVAADGYDVGDEEEFKSWLAEAMDETGSTNYWALENPDTTDRFGIYARVASAGKKVRVWWGDGTTQGYDSISTSSSTAISKVFASSAKRTVVIVGDLGYIQSNSEAGLGGMGATAFGGDIGTMPSLTYLYLGGSNTVSGSVAGLSSLTTLSIHGSNTITGSVEELAGLTYLNVQGSNTITGSVAGLTSLTYLNVTGSNTISGSVTNLINLTYLSVWGSNTISGSVEERIGMTTLAINGSNTITGDISGMQGLTYIYAWGNNTISGSVAGMPLQHLKLGGYSTVDVNSTVGVSETATGLTRFELNNNYTLTQTQVDTILANFWANRDDAKPRSNERAIDINEVNHAVPSAAGLADKANLQAYMSPNNTGPMVWTVNTR